MSYSALWVIAGLALCAAEMVVPGAFLLWIGLAACGVGALTEAFGLDWPAQVAGFIAIALALIGAAAVRTRTRPRDDTVNAPNAGLIGATCYALAFDAGEGRVSLRDGTWQARVADGTTPALGEAMRVVALDGTTLLVARADRRLDPAA